VTEEEIVRLKNRERQRQFRARDKGKAAKSRYYEETLQGRSILLERGVTDASPSQCRAALRDYLEQLKREAANDATRDVG
jgi:hypothetical protein